MLIIGLTGGIATGKTTTANLFRARGAAVHDADAAVHELMASGGAAVDAVTDLFGPDIIAEDGSIDRAALGALVFQNPELRQALESVLHPLVATCRDAFIADCAKKGEQYVVLDVPLLFEVGGDEMCDFVIVSYAPDEMQFERGLQRPTMTETKLRAILRSQMPLAEKCARADLVVDTSHGIEPTREVINQWIDGPLQRLIDARDCGDKSNA